MKVLTDDFLNEVRTITELSIKKNKDKKIILDFIKKHAEEIEHLYESKDEHWAVETADLVVLCLELMLMEDRDLDKTFKKCLPRFYKKLHN